MPFCGAVAGGGQDPFGAAAAPSRRGGGPADWSWRWADDVRALYFAGGAHLALGERERGLERLEQALELHPEDFTTLYNAACGYARAGERERALDALERAAASGRGFRKWIDNDADLDPLRGGPRFEEILRRVKP